MVGFFFVRVVVVKDLSLEVCALLSYLLDHHFGQKIWSWHYRCWYVHL